VVISMKSEQVSTPMLSTWREGRAAQPLTTRETAPDADGCVQKLYIRVPSIPLLLVVLLLPTWKHGLKVRTDRADLNKCFSSHFVGHVVFFLLSSISMWSAFTAEREFSFECLSEAIFYSRPRAFSLSLCRA
jgi:hypothetical protein